MRNYEMRKKKRKLSGHSADPREKKWQHGSKVVFDSIVGSFGGGGGGERPYAYAVSPLVSVNV